MSCANSKSGLCSVNFNKCPIAFSTMLRYNNVMISYDVTTRLQYTGQREMLRMCHHLTLANISKRHEWKASHGWYHMSKTFPMNWRSYTERRWTVPRSYCGIPHKLLTQFCYIFSFRYIIKPIMDLSNNLPIFSMVFSLAEGQSYKCSSANELTLNDIGKSKTNHNKITIAWIAHIFLGWYFMCY